MGGVSTYRRKPKRATAPQAEVLELLATETAVLGAFKTGELLDRAVEAGRQVTLGTLYGRLRALETKGFVSSTPSHMTRDGRAPIYWTATTAGVAELQRLAIDRRGV